LFFLNSRCPFMTLKTSKTTPARREKGNERRRLVLAATQSLLAQRPLEEITLADIAEAAAIPVSSLYHFYPKILNVYSDLIPVFSAELSEYLMTELGQVNVPGWQQLIDTGIDICAEFYRLNPAFQQLILSGKAPGQLKSVDRAGDARLAQALLEMVEFSFELPVMPAKNEIFFNAIEIVDLFLSLDVMRNGSISASGIEEAKRACKSYLRSYLPETLYLKTS